MSPAPLTLTRIYLEPLGDPGEPRLVCTRSVPVPPARGERLHLGEISAYVTTVTWHYPDDEAALPWCAVTASSADYGQVAERDH